MGVVSRFIGHTAARFVPRLTTVVQCSACGRTRSESVRLISGPGLYFCYDCFQTAAGQLAPRALPADAVACGFCGQCRPPADVTSVGSVTVCANCLSVMQHIFAEATP